MFRIYLICFSATCSQIKVSDCISHLCYCGKIPDQSNFRKAMLNLADSLCYVHPDGNFHQQKLEEATYIASAVEKQTAIHMAFILASLLFCVATSVDFSNPC